MKKDYRPAVTEDFIMDHLTVHDHDAHMSVRFFVDWRVGPGAGTVVDTSLLYHITAVALQRDTHT
jgi:hypothetical protein